MFKYVNHLIVFCLQHLFDDFCKVEASGVLEFFFCIFCTIHQNSVFLFYFSTVRSCISLPGADMRMPPRRAVFKSGKCNEVPVNLSKYRLKFLHDIFTTLVDCRWRWTLLLCSCSFVLSWLLFAVIWWLIGYVHGDFEPMNLPANQG